MSLEQNWPLQNPPEEIEIDTNPEPKVNKEGKKYQYEKDGVYYGGDYLPEPPSEIDPNLPPPPPENNLVI